MWNLGTFIIACWILIVTIPDYVNSQHRHEIKMEEMICEEKRL